VEITFTFLHTYTHDHFVAIIQLTLSYCSACDLVMWVNVEWCCSETIDIVDLLEARCHMVSLPISIHSLSMTSPLDWVITESQTHRLTSFLGLVSFFSLCRFAWCFCLDRGWRTHNHRGSPFCWFLSPK